MLEVGWSEMLVIAVVMIVVVGPKDLPRMLRTIGRTTAKMREMAGDFRKQFDDAMKEADLDDLKKTVDTVRGLNPTADIKKALNPMEKAAADVRAGLEAAMKPTPKPGPAATTAQVMEPLKTGPTPMPEAALQSPTVAVAPAAVEAKPVPVEVAKAPAKKPAAKSAAPAKPTAKAAPAAKPAAKPEPKKPAAKTKAST